MPRLAPRTLFSLGGFALFVAAYLLGACGGKSASVSSDDDDDTHARGGSSGATSSQGGTGGSDVPGKGGTGTAGTGDAANGGTGGPTPNCEGVTCAPLPTTCKLVVQPPNACCPICKETGCDPCEVPDCEIGTHAETVPGDCCPTCVAEPQDPCEQGRSAYLALRQGLLDKYGSIACTNSSECQLVMEDNTCLTSCPLSLPTKTVENYSSNLNALTTACSSCEPPVPPELCDVAVAACVNGLCATARP